VYVEISEGCGGVWLDWDEIKQLDEVHESAGDKLIDILAPFVKEEIDLSKKIKCPKCPDSILLRNFYSPKRSFQIDTCPTCSGMWLDPGELTKVRTLFKTEEEKIKYVSELVHEVTEKDFAPEREKTEKFTKRTRAFAHAFRFICPTYYIPGKQDWGAF